MFESVDEFLATCPVPQDPHQAARVRPATLVEYRRQIRRFLLWLDGQQLAWWAFWQLDLLMVRFKQASPAGISRADFGTLVAAAEFAMPWARGKLCWSHAVLEGWNVSGPTSHSIRLPDALALVIAAAW